jgi:nitrate reductase NapAB chaperone NapD/uncharacterized protein YqgV (UPF0045/DUF77 family)
MGLKKLYYNLEDKYYSFVERTGLYKITDKIDKVMPSFILFILLIVILISGLVFLLLPSSQVKDGVDIQFEVIDAESGVFLEDVTLIITTSTGFSEAKTSSQGLTDYIKIPKNSSYQIDIVEDAYENFNDIFSTKESSETITIALEPSGIEPLTVSYSFDVVDSKTNQVLNSTGAISFKCINGSLAPAPMTLSSGNVTVEASPECSLVIESISFTGYLSKYNLPINTMTGTVSLEPTSIDFEDDDKYTLVINVKNSSNEALSNIKVNLTNAYGIIDSKTTSSNGNVTFEEVESGEYMVNFSDQRATPIYSTLSRTYYISSDITKSETLSSDVSGYIFVRVIGEDSGALEGAEVNLKTSENNTIETKLSDVDGEVIFTVSEIKDYNIVVDAEGYLITRKLVEAKEVMPTNPIVIPLPLITPATLASLKVQVTTWEGKPFKFAKVVLYDAETGFLTDYKPVLTNYDGNATLNITSGKYIAKAIKGSVTGESSEFEFNVKYPELSGTVTIPMGISEGVLNVSVVDNDGNPMPNARIDLYDRYSYYNFTPAVPLKSEITDSQGNIEMVVDADIEYYVVATDYLDDVYGKTQSRFVYVGADSQESLKVTLYPRNSSTTKPRMVFNGIYKDDLKVEDNLKAGEDYKIRYNLLVPQNRTGDDVFEEIGFMLRTGSTSMIENDSLFIKYLDVPYLDSIQKYTQFNLNAPHENEGYYDEDSLTEGNFKWAKATLKEGPINYNGSFGFYNAYEIEAIISVKDTAVFGEELKIFSLGYGLNEDDEYETYNSYLGPNEEIEYYDVYDQITFGVGNELFCSDEFCFSSTIVDVSEDLRYDVTNNFAAMPNKDYKYSFTLINNSLETVYLSSRFILENIDEGLDFKNIKIYKPDGEVYTQTNTNENEFDIPITSLTSKQKVTGEIIFMPKLKGTRELSIKFISDQKIKFINQLFIDVLSDKTFEVEIEPSIIPSAKSFSLVINAVDSKTKIPVENRTITIKDKFKDTIKGPISVSDSVDEIEIGNIPAQGPGDTIYVYITAPEYETVVEELKATDKLYNIIPRNLAYSLNIFDEKQKTEKFTINNLSPIDLTIDEMVVKGNGLEVVDLHRINNTLLNSVGVIIKGFDSVSDLPDNTDASKEIPLTISLNPRAETIREVVDLSSTLHIVLSNGENQWKSEIPIKINIGFDGMIDNSNCLTLSQDQWNAVALNKAVDTTFMVSNKCSVNGTNMPLSNGLEARVLFESNPQGKFIVSLDNRSIELTHGNYRRLLDTFDRDRSLPVILKYEPAGRMKGTVKGTIEFRSVNNTGSGEQELVSSIAFEIDVTNLKDCVVFSKSSLNVGQVDDEFTIENVSCPADMTYRLSCDNCQGLVVEPRNNIDVPASGSSENIVVRNMGATPGAYVLNVFSSMKEFRGSEELIKRIKVYVRPTDYCVDLERYEFDLYRSEYSESTGLELNATSYDTTNLINLCYGQEVEGTFSVKEDAKWKMALTSFLREGLYTGGISAILQGKLFASAEDKANKLLESDAIKNSKDDKVKEAAAALAAAVETGNNKDIKEKTAALETAIEDSVKPTSPETKPGETTEGNKKIENAKNLIKEVNDYRSQLSKLNPGETYFQGEIENLEKLIQELNKAIDSKIIENIDSAYESLKTEFEKFKNIHLLNSETNESEKNTTIEEEESLEVDESWKNPSILNAVKDKTLADSDKLVFKGTTYESKNYSNWDDFVFKYNKSVKELYSFYDGIYNTSDSLDNFSKEVKIKNEKWESHINFLIKNLKEVDDQQTEEPHEETSTCEQQGFTLVPPETAWAYKCTNTLKNGKYTACEIADPTDIRNLQFDCSNTPAANEFGKTWIKNNCCPSN